MEVRPYKKRKRFAFLFLLGLTSMAGCQNGPVIGRMKQYQLENERLLSEFQSQKREVEQLRADRKRLLEQQAETEKLAARLQSQLRKSSDGSSSYASRSQSNDPTRVAQQDRSARTSKESNASRSFDNWQPIRKSPK